MIKSYQDSSFAAVFTITLIFMFSLLACGSDDAPVSNWTITTIDSEGDVGSHTSIVNDPDGNMHISYRDNTNQNLKYATNASGSWRTLTIDSSANVGTSTSIALDSANKVHISYRDLSSNKLKYITNAAGSWEAATLDNCGWDGSINDGNTSIAMDSGDKAHISYFSSYSSGSLKYATNASGAWTNSIVNSTDVNKGYFSSLALDSSDIVHISYFDLPNSKLVYATNSPGVWTNIDIDDYGSTGCFTSIDIDSNDRVHVSYQYSEVPECYNDGGTNTLMYVTNATGAWITNTLDSAGNLGTSTSIVLDPDDSVHIGYLGGPINDLLYITNSSGSWSAQTVDNAEYTGFYPSLALDGSGKVHISYYDSLNGNLMYAVEK